MIAVTKRFESGSIKSRVGAWISGFCTPKFTKRGITCRATSVLNKFFFKNYNFLPLSGVRAESLQVGSENTPNFVTFFGLPCSLRMTRKKSK